MRHNNVIIQLGENKMNTKNQLSEEVKAEIRREVRQARRKGNPPLKEIAAKYNLHPTAISKIAPPNGTKATVKAAPKAKRKTAKAAKSVQKQYTDADWERAFENYISLRDQFAEADKLLKKIARKLK